MRTAEFEFELPWELIAQTPAPQRDESRLLVLRRDSGEIEHRTFRNLLDYLRPGDVLVLNDSRVIPARLRGVNARTGGRFEMLLLEEHSANEWWAMIRPARRARIGTEIVLLDKLARRTAVKTTVQEREGAGHYRLSFTGLPSVADALPEFGEVPLPPYIHRDAADRSSGRSASPDGCDDVERYQTVFARPAGSIAAPTAGLHFTQEMLAEIRRRGVQTHFVTLHVGLGTFTPVKAETISAHVMHEERYKLDAETAEAINAAKASGRRVIAVGTTVVRVLESVSARNGGRLVPETGRTRIFIFPPYDFRIVDGLLTNFHLPRSTLLMLVSAFAAPKDIRGREMVLRAYAGAVCARYRFFSYGDAMIVL